MANFNPKEMAKIAVDKKLCKEYRDASKGVNDFIVYLNDGDEFQIQLFNPTTDVIAAKITFNDENRTSQDSLLVLRPGERIWLERFLNCSDKFVFNTYEVSNSRQVMEAIKDNGDLTIEFFREEKHSSFNLNDLLIVSEPHIYYSDSINTSGSGYSASTITCGTNSRLCTTKEANFSASTLSCADAVNISSSVPLGASYTCTCSYNDAEPTRSSRGMSKSIETGRVEYGSHSNQKFKNVYYNFEYFPFVTKRFKLLPVSRKQYSDSDLRKCYCTNCGKKLSPKFKFCPACGEKVNS